MNFTPVKLVCTKVGEKIVREVTAYDETLHTAACSRAFAVNYTVFLQIPPDDKESQLKVWKAMLQYRDAVARDRAREIRPKNKVGALCTYLGMRFSYKFGRVYKMIETKQNARNIHRGVIAPDFLCVASLDSAFHRLPMLGGAAA